MASRIVQRLVAAGASPERAAQFERQFAATRPGLAPKKLEDAFDAELGAIAASIWPNTFRPPALDDPRINDYIIGAYGEDKLNNILEKAWSTAAPTFSQAIVGVSKNTDKNTLSLDKYIAYELYYGGKTAGQIQQELQTDAGLAITGNLEPSAVNARVNKLSNEINNVAKAEADLKYKFLQGDNGDKYYKAGLPTPKLKYGETTDLAKGIIDFRTNPTVERVLKDPKQFEKFTTKRAGVLERSRGLAARAGDALSGRELRGIEQQFATEDPVQAFEKDVFKSFTESYKGTPFFDEVQRRESVKGKTIK